MDKTRGILKYKQRFILSKVYYYNSTFPILIYFKLDTKEDEITSTSFSNCRLNEFNAC